MVKLKVADMSCEHCVRAIEKAVRGLDPTAVVKASLEASTVTIETTADESAISQAIRAAGYDNSRVPA